MKRTSFLASIVALALLALAPIHQANADSGASCPVGSSGYKTVTGTTYTVLVADQCSLLNFTNASAVSVTLPNVATTFPAGFRFSAKASGAGAVTITPTTATINGLSTLVLTSGLGADIWTDHTNYIANGGYGSTGGVATCTAAGTSAQTCNGSLGVVTTGVLTTASSTAASAYTISNSSVTSASVIQCMVDAYSGTVHTNGTPAITQCVPGTGTIAVSIQNVDTANALSGTVGIGFRVN